MLYCIKSPENQQLKTFVKKYVRDIPINTTKLQGSFSILNIRFYTYTIELEISFKGKMYGRLGRNPSLWLSSDILKKDRISKVRINRHIKKSLIDKIQTRLSIFGLDLKHYSDIKKLKWI